MRRRMSGPARKKLPRLMIPPKHRRSRASAGPAVGRRPRPRRVGASPPAPNEQRKSSPPALAPLAPLERRLKRRLTSGKAQVDDVLDLHGLTQAQAHRRLNHFLWRSAENGAKLVLIITGKGAAIAADESFTRSNAACCAAIRRTGFARPNCGPSSFRSKRRRGPMAGRARSMFASGVVCVADEST